MIPLHLRHHHHHHHFIPKTPISPQIPTTHPRNALQTHVSIPKTPPSRHPTPLHLSKVASFFRSAPTHLSLLASLSSPLPSLAVEADQTSSKINLESIVVAIDDFNNRNPFFVAGLAFVWLIVIPLAQEYLKKCKFISAIDAFRKLRDDPGSQLLDVRRKQSVAYLSSPNLKIVNKDTVLLEFVEGEEEGFVKEVLKRFEDPKNTVICILDNFFSVAGLLVVIASLLSSLFFGAKSFCWRTDWMGPQQVPSDPAAMFMQSPMPLLPLGSFDGNSLKVAELLFKNGFKEAYAIKGGVRGKDGWQEIQEKLLPPAAHVYPGNKSGTSPQLELNNRSVGEPNIGNSQQPTSGTDQDNHGRDNGSINPKETIPEAKLAPQRSLSPFPNYPDLKPPSSPTPSKP